MTFRVLNETILKIGDDMKTLEELIYIKDDIMKEIIGTIKYIIKYGLYAKDGDMGKIESNPLLDESNEERLYECLMDGFHHQTTHSNTFNIFHLNKVISISNYIKKWNDEPSTMFNKNIRAIHECMKLTKDISGLKLQYVDGVCINLYNKYRFMYSEVYKVDDIDFLYVKLSERKVHSYSKCGLIASPLKRDKGEIIWTVNSSPNKGSIGKLKSETFDIEGILCDSLLAEIENRKLALSEIKELYSLYEDDINLYKTILNI